MRTTTACLAFVCCLLAGVKVAAQSAVATDQLAAAIDRNGRGELSAEEIRSSPDRLLSLDRDGDGMLSATEFGGLSSMMIGLLNEFRRGFGPAPSQVISGSPVLQALDTDDDGALSAQEIADSPIRLLALDANNSGTIERAELTLEAATGQAAQLVIRGRGGRVNPPGGGTGGTGTPDPASIPFEDGAAELLSHDDFERLSYQGKDVLIDTQLIDLEYVKFVIANARTADPKVYFMNTNRYRAHMQFASAMGIRGASPWTNTGEQMLGVLVYRPLLATPDGRSGLYTFEFEPNNAFDYKLIQIAHDELTKHAPVMAGRLAYHPLPNAMSLYQRQRNLYESAGLPVFLDDEASQNIAYLPLHDAESFGLLRLMNPDERPGVRDIVIYETLPNEMPHVAGIITGEQQTPLSHVNLRAVQDGIPNAFVLNAAGRPDIAGLIGRYVYFKVMASGFELREASLAEFEMFFADRRPAGSLQAAKDLTVRTIRPLDEIGFDDSASVGVKAANVAVLRSLDLGPGVVPDGFAIPFYFYDQFMKHNGFYALAREMQSRPGFDADTANREAALTELREAIEAGAMPQWMMDALAEVQEWFSGGTGVRLRSSTNNEDLPGFSGAGLYDSTTHRADDGHIAASVRKIYASLWNFRAFEEREFFRIDHESAAMGVLVHPNYSNELANGVAVSDDIIHQAEADQPGRTYYVNVQVGEDLVTNPEARSVPEELLLNSIGHDGDRLIRRSNRSDGQPILGPEFISQLRIDMNRIHNAFRELYRVTAGEPFALEIEFKITEQGRLAIKQARPWVY